MRLCQPYLSALARSFFAVWLLSGVIVMSWLAAAVALAQLIDAKLAVTPTATLIPLVAIISIAISGALVVQLARTTLLNRRRIWLAHGMGEAVLAHETWLNSETRHRTRSLAAVDTIAYFTGSRAATALAEAPWAILLICSLWSININIAAIAGISLVVLATLALSGSRLSRAARQFDTAFMAHAMGHDIMRQASGNANASLDHARRLAAAWENTQRALMASSYMQSQTRSRRVTLAVSINLLTLGAMTTVATSADDMTTSAGTLAATCLVAMGALSIVSRWAVDAFVCARARAAVRQLGTLRVARTRGGEARLPIIARPDLRAPMAAGVLATAATIAALAGAAVHWQLPMSKLVGMTTAQLNPSAAVHASAASQPRHELERLRIELIDQQYRLGELRLEAEKPDGGNGSEGTFSVLQHIEGVAQRLTSSMAAMMGRIATLERELAMPTGSNLVTPSPKTVAVSRDLS